MILSWDEQYLAKAGLRAWPDLSLIAYLARTYPERLTRSSVAVLEVGCGNGANLWGLADEGFHNVTGVDLSTEALALAAETLDAKGAKVELLHGSALALPVADSECDLVLDIQCLQHLSPFDHVMAYRDIQRVLRPGGRFFSVHLATGTDFDDLYPTTPEAWLPCEMELRGALHRGGLCVDDVAMVTRERAGLSARWFVVEGHKA